MKKVIISLSVLTILFSLFYLYFLIVSDRLRYMYQYVDHYDALIGLYDKEKGTIRQLSSIIKKIGKPLKIIIVNNRVDKYVYDDFYLSIYKWQKNKGAGKESFCFTITSNKIKLGFFKISVGSSKLMVKIAYFFKLELKDKSYLGEDDNKLGFADANRCVIFSFNENGLVKEINIGGLEYYGVPKF